MRSEHFWSPSQRRRGVPLRTLTPLFSSAGPRLAPCVPASRLRCGMVCCRYAESCSSSWRRAPPVSCAARTRTRSTVPYLARSVASRYHLFVCVWLDQSAGFSCMTGVRAADCDSQHAKAPAASAPIGIAARGGTATQTTFPTNGARSSATSRFPAFALRCLRAVWLPALIFTNARVRAHHAV